MICSGAYLTCSLLLPPGWSGPLGNLDTTYHRPHPNQSCFDAMQGMTPEDVSLYNTKSTEEKELFIVRSSINVLTRVSTT